jgi:hypothetical protein
MADLRESRQKDEQNDKIQRVAFKYSVWVSVGVTLIIGIITIWYYRGLPV